MEIIESSDNPLDLRVTVRIQLRHKIGKRDLQRHIEEAVECWGKALHPDDPLFDGIERVTVTFPKVAP